MRVLNGFIGFVSKGSIPNRVCVEKWDNGLGGEGVHLAYLIWASMKVPQGFLVIIVGSVSTA